MTTQSNNVTTKSTHRRAPSATRSGKSHSPSRDSQRQLIGRIGPIEMDWPRSIGYFGGIGVAVAAGVIDPPLGLFIAAVPFLKMLDLPRLPTLPRFVGQVFEGVAKPVGGDSEGTIRLVTGKGVSDQRVTSSS